MKGEVKMENKLRGNCDLAYSAREGLPDEVKRLYEAMGPLAFSKKMYPQLLGIETIFDCQLSYGVLVFFERKVSSTNEVSLLVG